jgi:hypothetical protein
MKVISGGWPGVKGDVIESLKWGSLEKGIKKARGSSLKVNWKLEGKLEQNASQ